MHDVHAALADEAAQRPHHLRRRAAARLRRGRELEAEVLHARDERSGLAEDDHLVAEVAHGRGQLDGVDLAAADLQPVRVDDDLHADSRTSSGSGANPASAAGEPIHLRSLGTSRVTTEPIPTSARAPTLVPSRRTAAAPM